MRTRDGEKSSAEPSWHMAALCRAHRLTVASKKAGPCRQMAETRSWQSKLYCGPEVGVFPPGPAETCVGLRVSCVAPNSSIPFRLRWREAGGGRGDLQNVPRKEGHPARCSSRLSLGHCSQDPPGPSFLGSRLLRFECGFGLQREGRVPVSHSLHLPVPLPLLLLILTFFTGLLSLRLDLELGGAEQGGGSGWEGESAQPDTSSTDPLRAHWESWGLQNSPLHLSPAGDHSDSLLS